MRSLRAQALRVILDAVVIEPVVRIDRETGEATAGVESREGFLILRRMIRIKRIRRELRFRLAREAAGKEGEACGP